MGLFSRYIRTVMSHEKASILNEGRLPEEPIDTDDSEDEDVFIFKQKIVSNLGRLGYVSDRSVATVMALNHDNSNRRIEDDYHYDDDDDEGLTSFAKRQKMTTPSSPRKRTSRSVRGRPRVKIDRSTFGKIKPLLTEDEVALTTPNYGEDRLESFKKADSEAKPMPEGFERPGKPVTKAIRMGDAEVKIVNEKRYHEAD